MVASAPFADPSDVAGIWRPLSDAELTVATSLLDEASQIILEVPAVAARIAADLVADATLRTVCARMVFRAMRNSQGLKQFSVAVDDVSRSGTYESTGVPAGELMLTANDLDRLLGRVGASAAFTAMPPWLLVPSTEDFLTGSDVSKLYLLDPTD